MSTLADYRHAAMLESEQYRAAVEQEQRLKVTCQTSAKALLDAATELGWGSGIPWYDAVYWLQEAARGMGIDVPAADPRADTGRKAIPRVIVRAVWDRDGWECVTCGSHRDLTIDHIRPINRDGTNEIGNLQTMCKSCNSRKRDRVEVDL